MKQTHERTLNSSLVAKLDRVARFFAEFYKAVGLPFLGDDNLPKGAWTNNMPIGDAEYVRHLRKLSEHGFESIFRASASMQKVIKLMHQALADGSPVKEAGTLKDILYARRALLRTETWLIKNAPRSELTSRLLASGVVDLRRDQFVVDTYHDVFEKAFSDALEALTTEIAEVRQRQIAEIMAKAEAEKASTPEGKPSRDVEPMTANETSEEKEEA